jgi:hypothetical protein
VEKEVSCLKRDYLLEDGESAHYILVESAMIRTLIPWRM